MKVVNIVASESEPRYSAYEPDCKVAFGVITFEIEGVSFRCPTADRDTFDLYVGSKDISLYSTDWDEVNAFIKQIWNMSEVEDIKIPQIILDNIK